MFPQVTDLFDVTYSNQEFQTYFDGAVEKISSNSIGRSAPSWETRMKFTQPNFKGVL